MAATSTLLGTTPGAGAAARPPSSPLTSCASIAASTTPADAAVAGAPKRVSGCGCDLGPWPTYGTRNLSRSSYILHDDPSGAGTAVAFRKKVLGAPPTTGGRVVSSNRAVHVETRPQSARNTVGASTGRDSIFATNEPSTATPSPTQAVSTLLSLVVVVIMPTSWGASRFIVSMQLTMRLLRPSSICADPLRPRPIWAASRSDGAVLRSKDLRHPLCVETSGDAYFTRAYGNTRPDAQSRSTTS